MVPIRTIYRLALNPMDFRRCKEVWRHHPEMGIPYRLSWPTVVAEREKKILGFLSTDTSQDVIIAGPLIVNGIDGHSGIVVMRLIEAYEVLLKKAGVRNYLFYIDAKNKNWLDIVQRVGLSIYRKKNGKVWFRRELQ